MREYKLSKLLRDWPALRTGLYNGRKLNRLSTKQLDAKLRQLRRMTTKRTTKYVTWMDSFMEQDMANLAKLTVVA